MKKQSAQYDPHFWIFGSVSPEFLAKAKELSFVGVGYLAANAEREGNTLRYYFNSPTLERFDWALRVTEGEGERSFYTYAGNMGQGTDLAGFAAKAHALGLKVMANMEGGNPYHWPAGQKNWTPEIIAAVAADLHKDGADRWFTECVAGWPPLFNALADAGRKVGMEYQEGDDPSYVHMWEGEGRTYADLYRNAHIVSMYHYHYRRDEMGKHASLAQMGTLAYGFGRVWNMPMALVYPTGYDWGENPEYWEGILKASILIRALQFRVRDIMLIGDCEDEAKMRKLDVLGMTRWARELVAKNAQEQRPVLNVVVHLRTGRGSHWRDFATSGDAISSGAFHSGYDVVTSKEPLPDADAYYVYTTGEDEQGVLELTPEIGRVFAGAKPAFLQIGSVVPSGEALSKEWRQVLASCGVSTDAKLTGGEMPARGTYRGTPVAYTGAYTAYDLVPRPLGTPLPKNAVTGTVVAEGDGVPLIVGKGNKHLIPANCINWQMMYPIGHLLNGSGALSSSDVWGIAGSRVTALLAIHDTELDLTIPGLKSGAKIRVSTWDKHHQKTGEERVSYAGAYRKHLDQFDFVLIEAE